MKSLLATILSVPCVAATAGYVGPFTSFAGDKKCTSVPADSSHTEGTATNYALDYSCDSLQVPSAWQKRMEPEEGDFDFELAIVGGGVGGAYLVNRLHEEFVIKRGQAMPNIALFERSDKMGGRLMSGYGAGALNLGVQPMSKELYDKQMAFYKPLSPGGEGPGTPRGGGWPMQWLPVLLAVNSPRHDDNPIPASSTASRLPGPIGQLNHLGRPRNTILTFATAGYIHWVKHLHRNLRHLRLDRQSELRCCVPDNTTAALIRAEGLRPVLPVRLAASLTPSTVAASFLDSRYVATLRARVECISSWTSQQPIGAKFMFIDTDVTLFSNPWPHFPKRVDMALLDDTGPSQKGPTSSTLNAGCFFLRVNNATRSLWRSMVRMHQLHPEIRNDQVALNHLLNLRRRDAYQDSIEPGARPVRVAALAPSTFLNGYRFYEARRNGFGVAEASQVVLAHHNWIRGDIEKWRRARDFHALAISDTEPAATFLSRARAAMRHKSAWSPK